MPARLDGVVYRIRFATEERSVRFPAHLHAQNVILHHGFLRIETRIEIAALAQLLKAGVVVAIAERVNLLGRSDSAQGADGRSFVSTRHALLQSGRVTLTA